MENRPHAATPALCRNNYLRGHLMGFYTKLAVLLMRSMGLIILLYSVPMVLYGFVRVGTGATTASDGLTSSGSALLGWLVYAVAGLFLFVLARPLGRVASRGLDEPTSLSP